MTADEQKELFKTAIKKLIPIMNPQLGDALDFADKFIELGLAFGKLNYTTQQRIIDAFFTIAYTTYPLQFNQNYNRF